MITGKSIVGKRFGMLTVLQKAEDSGKKSWRMLCQCDCGKQCIVTKRMLYSGKAASCGCEERGRKTNAMYPLRLKGLDALADAIIERAAKDYRMAFMRYLKKKEEGNLEELRRFFRSDWCEMLTELDAELLIKRIEQDCITEFERTKKRGKHKNQVPEGHIAD